MFNVRLIMIVILLLGFSSTARAAELTILFDTSNSGDNPLFAIYNGDDKWDGQNRYNAMIDALTGFYEQIDADLKIVPWSGKPHQGFLMGRGVEAATFKEVLYARLPTTDGPTELDAVLRHVTRHSSCRIFLVLTDGEHINLEAAKRALTELLQQAPVGIFVIRHDLSKSRLKDLTALSMSPSYRAGTLTTKDLMEFVAEQQEALRTCGLT